MGNKKRGMLRYRGQVTYEAGDERYWKWWLRSKRTHLTRAGICLFVFIPRGYHEAWLRVGSQSASICYFGHQGQWHLPWTLGHWHSSWRKTQKRGVFFHLMKLHCFSSPPYPAPHNSTHPGSFGFRVLKCYNHCALVAFPDRQPEERSFFWPGENRP